VQVRELHGESLGSSLWASAGLLTHFLWAYLPSARARKGGQLRVLELGCGVGLPGIFCALCFDCAVTLTDVDEVLPVTRANVLANGLTDKVQVAELVWGWPLPLCAEASHYDLVIGADVLYRHEHLKMLLETLLQLTSCGNEVLIAYKQRIKSDDAFFEEAALHFDISTVWKTPDVQPRPFDDSAASAYWEGWALEQGAPTEHLGDSDFSGRGAGSATGDWVSGATPCILRFQRRIRDAALENPPPTSDGKHDD